jgi:hypothetical protein
LNIDISGEPLVDMHVHTPSLATEEWHQVVHEVMLADILHRQQLAQGWPVGITHWHEQVDVRSQNAYTGASELHVCLSPDQYVEPDNLVGASREDVTRVEQRPSGFLKVPEAVAFDLPTAPPQG